MSNGKRCGMDKMGKNSDYVCDQQLAALHMLQPAADHKGYSEPDLVEF